MVQEFDSFERAKLAEIASNAFSQAGGNAGKVKIRAIARDNLGRFPGRTYGSIYAEFRRMFRRGGWWSHVPVSHGVI